MQEISVNDILKKSKEDLSGKWGTAVLLFVVYMAISIGLSIIPILGSIASFLLAAPFAIGLAIFSLNVVEKREIAVNQLFDGFKYEFGKIFLAYLLMVIFILLWSLLLIIPGIIAALGYSQTFYLMTEDKSLDSMEALRKSKKIMEGHKMEYFIMCMAFLGLAILCILTLGIGFFFLMPYTKVCAANFYRKLVPAEDTNPDYGEGKEHVLPHY